MAKNNKISDWAKSNKDLLIDMYDKGYIEKEDIIKMNNRDEEYTIDAQNRSFEKIKNDIQSRYSDDKINSDEAKKILGQERLDGFRKFRESVDKFDVKNPLVSAKIIDQIDNSGIESPVLNVLKKHIKDMSDKDTREFIFNNREFLKHTFKDDVLENIPDLHTQVNKSPDYGVQDTNFDKMFEDLGQEDVLDNFYDMDWRDIATIAKQKGITFKELMLQMQDAKIDKDRDDIAHGRWNNTSVPRQSDNPKKGKFWSNMGNELGGSLMTAFTPRRQEAIARGEDPSLKDTALDITENALYALPMGSVGRGVKLVGAGTKVGSKVGSKVGNSLIGKGVKSLGGTSVGKVAKAVSPLTNNFVVPTITEAMDSYAYDNEDDPRADFSIVDPLIGGAVNIATPLVLRRGGSFLKRVTDNKMGGKLSNLGQGQTAKEMTDEVRKKIAKDNKILEKYKGLPKGKRNPSQPTKDTRDSFIQSIDADDRVRARKLLDDYDAGGLDENYLKSRDFVLGVAESPGNTPSKKVENYQISRGKEPSDNYRLSDKQVPLYEALGLGATENAKGAGEIIKELVLQNFVTNKMGDVLYGNEESNIAMPIPFISNINQFVKDIEGKKDREKAKKKSEDKEDIGKDALKRAVEGQKQMQGVYNMLNPEMTVKRLYSNI